MIDVLEPQAIYEKVRKAQMNIKQAEEEVDRQVLRALGKERITASCVTLRLFGNGYAEKDTDFTRNQLLRLLRSGAVDREQGPLHWLWFQREPY